MLETEDVAFRNCQADVLKRYSFLKRMLKGSERNVTYFDNSLNMGFGRSKQEVVDRGMTRMGFSPGTSGFKSLLGHIEIH